MRMPLLALVAFGALGVATTLPAAIGSSPVPRTTATLAEARLIDRLREMAQPPDTTPDLPLRPRIEVAMATPAAAVQTPAEATETLVVVPPELNIRSEPDRHAAILGRLSQGETVAVAERANGWVRVSGPSVEGWANGEFLAAAH